MQNFGLFLDLQYMSTFSVKFFLAAKLLRVIFLLVRSSKIPSSILSEGSISS